MRRLFFSLKEIVRVNFLYIETSVMICVIYDIIVILKLV